MILVMILLVNAACASADHAGRPSESSAYNFTIRYPEEWKRVNTKKYYMITKDGPFSQYILAQQRRVDQPFAHTDKFLTKDMSPLDVSKIIVDEIQGDESVLDFKVVEIVPADVNGYDGFKMTFSYKIKKGYKFVSIYYGFLTEDWYYSLRFNATVEYFLEKDLKTFREILSSFKIMD